MRYKDQDALQFWPDYYLTKEEGQPKQVDFGPGNMRIKINVPGIEYSSCYPVFATIS